MFAIIVIISNDITQNSGKRKLINGFISSVLLFSALGNSSCKPNSLLGLHKQIFCWMEEFRFFVQFNEGQSVEIGREKSEIKFNYPIFVGRTWKSTFSKLFTINHFCCDRKSADETCHWKTLDEKEENRKFIDVKHVEFGWENLCCSLFNAATARGKINFEFVVS